MLFFSGCQKINNQPVFQSQNYQEFKIEEEVIGSIDLSFSDYQNLPLWSKDNKPLELSGAEPKGACDEMQGTILDDCLNSSSNLIYKFTIDDENYELIGTEFKNDGDTIPVKFAIEKNGQKIFEDEMCFGADGPIKNFTKINGKISFTFTGPCMNDENKVMAKSNIFYNGKTFNETYNIEESYHLFSFKEKIGFVGKNNEKYYIYFDGKKISNGYEYILSDGCCAVPYLLEVYENGVLAFLAIDDRDRDGSFENYIVEIDLNKYL